MALPLWAILTEVADSENATTIRERNRRVFASPFGAVYDFYIQREPLSRLVAIIAWHSGVPAPRRGIGLHGRRERPASRWSCDYFATRSRSCRATVDRPPC